MQPHQLRQARKARGWTQARLAARLGVSQAYVSMLERAKRPLPPPLARALMRDLPLPASAAPLDPQLAYLDDAGLELALANLGYPGFAHLGRARNRAGACNPAQALFLALQRHDLDSRLVEALPWVALRHADLDWDWLVERAKAADLQNQLGFVVTVARKLAARAGGNAAARLLDPPLRRLERARLAREDTLLRRRLSDAERRWLRQHRTPDARHWNLLSDLKQSDLKPEHLSYAP